MQKNIVVQKINSCYVSDDCIQIMFPYKKGLTILNPEGILYYDNDITNDFINNYLDDERRKKFPYSDIPTHKELFGLHGIYNVTNQILEFNKSYLCFYDGNIVENYAIKDGNEALIVSKLHSIYGEQKLLRSSEFEENAMELIDRLFEVYDENTYFLLGNGLIIDADYTIFFDNVPRNPFEKPFKIWKVQIADGKFIINGIKAMHSYENDYLVKNYYGTIFSKYTLEQLKYLSGKIKTSSNPNISSLLNPHISKKVIKNNKMLVKNFR